MQDACFYIDLDGETDNEKITEYFADGPIPLEDIYPELGWIEDSFDSEPFTLKALWGANSQSTPETIPHWYMLKPHHIYELYDQIKECPLSAPFELVKNMVEFDPRSDFPTSKDLYDMNPDRVIDLNQVEGKDLEEKFITLIKRYTPERLVVTDPDMDDEESLLFDAMLDWKYGTYVAGHWLIVGDNSLT